MKGMSSVRVAKSTGRNRGAARVFLEADVSIAGIFLCHWQNWDIISPTSGQLNVFATFLSRAVAAASDWLVSAERCASEAGTTAADLGEAARKHPPWNVELAK